MTQFRDRNWDQRVAPGGMGDLAEAKCLEHYPTNLVRWGLDRPPLQMYKLPKRIAHAPDFLSSNSFVECQGFGRDQIFKLKWVKMNCLLWWNDLHPVELFIYDSHNDRWVIRPLKYVADILDAGKAEFRQFPEGKGYWAIQAGWLFDA